MLKSNHGIVKIEGSPADVFADFCTLVMCMAKSIFKPLAKAHGTCWREEVLSFVNAACDAIEAEEKAGGKE